MSTVTPGLDYELEDVLTIRDAGQLKALADGLRGRIVAMLRERSASTTELAAALGLPKGTVGHHVKVLERAGLIRVVRTRRVRAVTEKYYGRVAKLFVLKGDDEAPDAVGPGTLAALMLRQAADEILTVAPRTDESAFLHVRLSAADARRLRKRLARLISDFSAAEHTEGELYGFVAAAFPTAHALPPRDDGHP
ncbi:MAG TPA: winged helix-turn-helix domain-containing protein [Gaiellaceae bacterium]|nr:winged helix-turn-helix domain-containing protein [Gaiellaceae bacterium]